MSTPLQSEIQRDAAIGPKNNSDTIEGRASAGTNGEYYDVAGDLIALAKQGKKDAYDRIVKRYYGFVRLKASSYFLAGGDSDDLIQEGLVGLYKAIRDYRRERLFRSR